MNRLVSLDKKGKETKYQTCQAAILIAVIRVKRVLFLFFFLFKKKPTLTVKTAQLIVMTQIKASLHKND